MIPPLFTNNKLQLNFKSKANHFNKFFADKCISIQNNSVIPNFTECESINRLTSIVFNDKNILNILRAFDVNKAHGHDDILIRMIKLCDKSIIPGIWLIYKNWIKTKIFPNIWNKSNSVLVHKKSDKQTVDNYRPVSHLPVFGKILERLIFNLLFEYVYENNLLNENQSGFRPSDSCEYQLLSIVHDIYAFFDCNQPRGVRDVILDISRTCDRVWHEGLIYKVKGIGVGGLPLKLIQSFLSHRFQTVDFVGQSSTWIPVTAGVTQGCIL